MMYFMVFNLIFVMNFVSGGDQEAAKWDRAAAGRTETEAREAAQWRRDRWILACDWLINVNTELWLVAGTMTQSSSPGYSDTEDRDELTSALRQERENPNLKVNMSWTASIVVKLEFSLQYMIPNSEYQIPCLTHFITCQRGHFWMKMCAHMVWTRVWEIVLRWLFARKTLESQ